MNTITVTEFSVYTDKDNVEVAIMHLSDRDTLRTDTTAVITLLKGFSAAYGYVANTSQNGEVTTYRPASPITICVYPSEVY